MKKSFKIAIVTVLVLLAGTAGVLYYYLNVKEYDVADEKVEEITKNDYKVDLPDLDSVVDGEENSDAEGTAADEDAEAAGTESGDSDSDSSTATASGGSTNSDKKAATSSGSSKPGNSPSKSTESKKKDNVAKDHPKKKPEITAEMIKSAYRPSFEDLQAQANSKIDALVGAAYSEYSTKKQNGESISITYFYRKYTSAGQALEASTDETFNYLYGALVSDLKARGFKESEANEFKTQYENAKEARESALLEKAKSAL